ncbi:MAG: ParB-like protein partition protein [Candidatus Jorgensenbacteria bacterium GW2011_GWA2_45_13]|uniref:ParB-like protein partition protein n=1 Tax=Candidatus Jorgensenbacteria bacterium GW2011_GWA2_45_13 TaxID=1618662 RepID=A0A0G1L4C8_9BACT|nr:MAG: ParB-like protein partition protein [Candidatus Jorgensenbacteria bacterium GW2011_GWA2_45_13]
MALGRGLQSLIPPERGTTNDSNKDIPQQTPHLEDARPQNLPSPHPVSKQVKEHHVPREEAVFQIEIEKIRANPYQPRRDFDGQGLEELARSIREFGIIQPLIVSKVIKETETGTEVEYQLIAGERRLRAARRAGLPSVPAIVRKFDTGRSKLEVALIENIQRSDLNAFETAKAYARLQDEFGLTQREIAARVGKSRESVGNTLRLLNLPSHIQQAISEGKINESQARTLLSIEDSERQERMFRELISGKTMTVRELRQRTAAPEKKDPIQGFWEKRLEEKLGAPVQLLRKGSRGKITIQFYSDEEMNALFEKLAPEDL